MWEKSHKIMLSIDTKNIGLHLRKCKKNTCMNSSMRFIVSIFGGENVRCATFVHKHTKLTNFSWVRYSKIRNADSNVKKFGVKKTPKKQCCCCWWHSTSNPYYEDSLRRTIKLHGYIFLLLISIVWRKQEIFELKEVCQLPSSADCRIRTLEVWDTRHAYTSWSYLRLLYIHSIVVSDHMHINNTFETLKRPTGASEAQVPIQNYMYPSIFIRSAQYAFSIPPKYCFKHSPVFHKCVATKRPLATFETKLD